MLRRSQSATQDLLLRQDNQSRIHKSLTARPAKRSEFINASEGNQALSVSACFQSHHGYEAREPQVTSVVHLLNGRPTFLLAGTGFGKSRVPEMFYHTHDTEKFAPIVLSINPLDSLGDDQVGEKAQVGLNAINLKGDNCTKEACASILQGDYSFVYVSPEIALTSAVFDQMWRDPRFQARLVLIVVDEAHMVYEWGLVESGEAKRLASHTRVNDGGVFRPSYGELARRFLSCDKVPLLLMSATCTPQAIHAILENLKLNSRDVRFTKGELVRPELRLIRRTFKRPLKASIRALFVHHTVTPTDSIPPSLLYSGTQNGTLDFLRLVHSSRGQPNEAANATSSFARRYHSNTGDDTKLSAVEAFVTGALAVLCCTLALGLGQNWHRVRRVVVVGRQDPCNFIQMAGRCGRDGRRGLAILLVDHKRTNGKNTLSDFKTPTRMDDDDRMDALAITPVCLRIALAVDLAHGYIPLDVGIPEVTEERERQLAEGMPACDCSNCLPEEAEALWLAQAALTNENFDTAMAMGEDNLVELVANLPESPAPPVTEARPVALLCGADDEILDSPIVEILVTRLERAFYDFFLHVFPSECDLGPADYFGRDLAWDLAKNIDIFSKPSDLGVVLASETIPGQFECLFQAFTLWRLEFNTEQLISDAAEDCLASGRGSGPTKVPQSMEGAEISKSRAEAAKEAMKLARLLAKERADEAKRVEREAKECAAEAKRVAKAQEKAKALQLRLMKKKTALPKRPATKGLMRSQQPGSSKRIAEDCLEGDGFKRRGSSLEPTAPQHSPHLPMSSRRSLTPNEILTIDPPLSQLGLT